MTINLGELLLKQNMITPQQLGGDEPPEDERWEARQGPRGPRLPAGGEEIRDALSRQHGVPSINLDHFEVDPEILKLMPSETARKYKVVPLSRGPGVGVPQLIPNQEGAWTTPSIVGSTAKGKRLVEWLLPEPGHERGSRARRMPSPSTMAARRLLLLLTVAGAAIALAPDAARSDDYITYEQVRYRHRFETDGRSEWTEEVRVLLRDASAVAAFGQLNQSYVDGYGDVEFENVAIEKPDGRRIDVQNGLLEDVNPFGVTGSSITPDVRLKKLTIPGLEPADRLSYRIVLRHKPLVPGRIFGEMKFPGLISDPLQVYELDLPRDPAIAVELSKDLGVSWEYVSGPSDRLVRRLTVRPKRPEFGPEGPTEVEIEALNQPDVMFTNFRSWSEVGEWWWGLSKDHLSSDAAVRAEAARIVTGSVSAREKIEAIHAFVATHVRYLNVSFGIGRMQPHAASEVLSNRYGDCKDNVALLSALANAVAIEVRPVLINSTRRHLRNDAPGPQQFDHMIGVALLGREAKDWLWLDATNELGLPGYLLPAYRDKDALMIDATGKGRIVHTPESAPFPQRVNVEMKGSLQADLRLRAHVRWTVRSDAEIAMRLAWRGTPRDRYATLVKGSLARDWQDATVTNVSTSDPSDTKEPFRVEFDAQTTPTNRCAEKEWDLRLPLGPFYLPAPRTAVGPEDKAVELSLDEVAIRAEIQLPEGVSGRAPPSASLDRPFAQFKSEYAVEGSTLKASRRMLYLKRSIAGAESASYEAFRWEVDKDRGQVFSIGPSVRQSVQVAPVTAEEAMASFDIWSTLDQVVEASDDFDPRQLLQLGPAGVDALLAKLMPESVHGDTTPPGAKEIAALVRRLGDPRCRVREEAAQSLVALGSPAHENLQAAARDDDPDIAARARWVLEQIQQPLSRKPSPFSPEKLTDDYGVAFGLYLARLTDRASLDLLAQRTLAALQAGRQRTESGFDFIEQVLATLVRTQDDALINILEPALELETEGRAAWVVAGIGANRPQGFVPRLLAEAAHSRRRGVAAEANAWLRELGNTTRPFSISSMQSDWSLQGRYEGVYDVDDDYVVIELQRATIVRTEKLYTGRETLDHLRVSLLRKLSESISRDPFDRRHSNRLPIGKMIENHQTIALPPVRFVISRSGIADLSSCWLTSAIESRTFDGVQGRPREASSLASDYTIFRK